MSEPNSVPSNIPVNLSGYALLSTPRLNKGIAFTDGERDTFGLHGLLPAHVASLDEQIQQAVDGLARQPDDLQKYVYLRDLQDTNETLFYALLVRDVPGLQPLVYTPTVGEACKHFSQLWRRSRGLFISYPQRDRIRTILSRPEYDQVKCIVVSDGERILGLGDQGAGGMGIPVGKMALYTALAGIHPEHCLPILLDVGTNNEEKRNSPGYMGWHHERIRGREYDHFIETFVSAVKDRWPHVLLQWEDFSGDNAARLLERYRDQLCTFNDDIQGTAAVILGTILSALHVSGGELKDQNIAIVGFGSAGIGFADLFLVALQQKGVNAEEARKRIYPLGSHGLLFEGGPGTHENQRAYLRTSDELEGWSRNEKGEITLAEVMRHARATVLIGATGKAGTFDEEAIREMARHTDRPVILPLSNPTKNSEATPEDILKWTDGRALVGTGSPFDPVEVSGRNVKIDQVNNSYIFPGLALGLIASRAKAVSDQVILTAAETLAGLSPARENHDATLLPDIKDSRSISLTIAEAVAKRVLQDGLAGVADESEISRELHVNVWDPVYVPYVFATEGR